MHAIMFARFFAVLLMVTTTGQAVAYASSPMDPTAVKQELLKRGVGKMVKIKEMDDKSFRGKIISLGDTSVTLQEGSKPAREIHFAQVSEVHNPGLSKRAKTTLILAGGVVIVIVVVAAIVLSRHWPGTIPI